SEPRAGHGGKNRRYWFTRLKIHRTVFDLHYDVVGKFSIQRREVVVGSSGPVGAAIAPVLPMLIDESAPKQFSPVRRYRRCKHIGAVGVIAPISKWPRLPFRIGLDNEAPKIRNVGPDIV